MSAMDHAAAHGRIDELLLEPQRLAELDRSTLPEDVALREHVRACAACRSDLDGWRALQRAVRAAMPDDRVAAASAVEPIALPPSLRAAVLAQARAEPRSQPTLAAPLAIRRRTRLAPLLAVAAALAVVIGSGFVVVDQASRRAAAEAETAALTQALAAVDRVLAEPGHVVVQLNRPEGDTAGSISWSRHDWVVITTALARPAPGQSYLCWLEDGGRSVLVGSMQFAGATAFWVASVDRYATWEITPTTRFVVTLQPDGGEEPSGPTLLEAALGA